MNDIFVISIVILILLALGNRYKFLVKYSSILERPFIRYLVWIQCDWEVFQNGYLLE